MSGLLRKEEVGFLLEYATGRLGISLEDKRLGKGVS